MLRAVGMATVMALVITGLLIVNLPRSGRGSGPAAPATFHRAGLAFDYPSDWTLTPSGVSMGSGRTILAFVGSAKGGAICLPVPSSGGALECDWFIASLEPNTLVARIQVDEASPWSQRDIIEGKAKSVVIGGLPALTGPSTQPASHVDADRVTTWILTSLQDISRHYIVTVAMRGPDVAGLESQVNALLATISLDPPPGEP